MPAWDLSQLDAATRQRIHQLHQNATRVQWARACLAQKQIAEFYRQNRPGAVNGLGEQTIALDPFWWNHYRRANHLAPGEEVELAEWLKKRRPEWCRVRSGGTRLQVGYWSTPEFRPSLRYRKTFNL